MIDDRSIIYFGSEADGPGMDGSYSYSIRFV